MKADRCPPAAAATDAVTRLDLSFEAEPFAVRSALARIVAAFAGQIGENAAGVLELALAEVLNNIVIHAYDRGGGSIDLSLEARGTCLHCRVSDAGRAIPGGAPVAAGPGYGPSGPPVAREGGWGWYILRSLTQDLVYERAGPENRLTFCIAVDAQAQGA